MMKEQRKKTSVNVVQLNLEFKYLHITEFFMIISVISVHVLINSRYPNIKEVQTSAVKKLEVTL